jgi:hypothetical protein
MRKKRRNVSNIGNPTINLNVSANSCGVEDTLALVRPSAFRAINTADQPVNANTPVKVLYPHEQFDLAGEYHPTPSTFIPKTNGVYLVIGFIGFLPDNPNLDYRARVEIRVNGNPAVAIDNDFFGGGSQFDNGVSVSTVVELQEGDLVEVFAQSNISGKIVATESGSHFEAARFPS